METLPNVAMGDKPTDECICSKCTNLKQDYSYLFDESYYWCGCSGEIIDNPELNPFIYCSRYEQKTQDKI